MSVNSSIEWTHHTFNPWWGCVEVSPGCSHCYARVFAKRTGHGVWGKHAPRRLFGASHWDEPRKWNEAAKRTLRRERVFCASMADVFEDFDGHPQEAELTAARERLFKLIEETPWLDWLLLTKRPHEMFGLAPEAWFFKWPENVWAGTTVEDQRRAEERIQHLLRVPAHVRFLSCEPLLGSVDLTRIPWYGVATDVLRGWDAPEHGIHWVICGGESGAGSRDMDAAWARSIRDQCLAAGVPFFFKQWGGLLKKKTGRLLDGRTWDEMPAATKGRGRPS